MTRTFAPLILLLLGFTTLLPQAQAQVIVTQDPPTVQVRTFDPKNPPADMPELTPPEAAVTRSKFVCGVSVEVEIEPGDKPVMTIATVRAQLSLENIIWLPTDAPAKLVAHEHGHRQIAETLYQAGESTAKRIAETYVGRRIPLAGTDKSHTSPAIQKIADEFCQKYLGATEVVATKVQERYDRITAHGQNRIAEKPAIDRAMREAGVRPTTATAPASTRPASRGPT